MSLDFAVLGQHGSPERTIPLNVDLHHEFVTGAASLGLVCLRKFEDFYEDVEIAVIDLPDLAEQVATFRTQAISIDLQHFLDELSSLITYAKSTARDLHAIAD